MATTSRATLKSWFITGVKPIASQFAAWIDSFWHKDDPIPISSIEDLQAALNAKADMDSVNSAIEDAIEDLELNVEVQDGSLTEKGIVMLSDTLAVDNTKAATPNLVAQVNTALAGLIQALAGNVYTKSEVEAIISAAVNGLDWKDGVAVFEDIAITYPTPELGWLVPVQSDGIIYKYNGTEWVDSYLSVLSAALMKYNQNEDLEPTFNGERLALMDDIPESVPDATTEVKGIVQLADDILEENDTKAATQGTVKREINGILSAFQTFQQAIQEAIENIELLPGADAPHVIFQYSENGSSWHAEYEAGDQYFRTSVDGGSTYGDQVFFKGPAGNSAFEDWRNIPGNEGKTIDDFWAYLQGGTFQVSIDFEGLTTFNYICPGAMKVDSVETNMAATVSVKKDGVAYVMGTPLAKFDEITITPSTLCFVNLNCSTL